MKKLNIATKVIIPLFIIGICTSLISFYYINDVLENMISKENEEKIENKLTHMQNYIKNEYMLYYYLHGKSKDNNKENISKEKTIDLLRKEYLNSKDIIYIKVKNEFFRISTQSTSNSLLEAISQDKLKTITINSINYNISSAYFKTWDWKIIYLQDNSKFDIMLHENQSFLFNISLLLLASLFIILIIIFNNNITKPLNILYEHLKRISQGDYSKIEQNFNSKEFKDLSHYINDMSKSVAKREKEAKELLRKTKESEDYILDILDSQKNIILVNDTNEIQTANSAFFKIFTEFKTIEEFKEKHRCICEFFIKEEGFVYDFEDIHWVDYILKNQEKIHKVKIKAKTQELTFAINVIKSKKYPRLIVSLTDITELEKSNKLLNEYKKAVDSAAIVSKTNPNGEITYVNDEFLNISGYKKEELIGKTHGILRSPNMPDSFFDKLWETIKSKKIWQGEIENINKNGESYFVAASIVPILDSNNQIAEYIGIRYDITDQVKAKEIALKAEEAKGLFLANMSHEIRTPLNGIIGFTKILANMSLDGKVQRYVNIIDNSAQNLLGIVNDILDLSKIESGNLSLEYIDFNPFEEFDSVINLFLAKVEEKNLKLLYFIDPKIPQSIIGDSLRLKQVLSNLISNAIKFTNDGYISVRIESIESNENYIKIKFAIKDTGIGIKKDKQEQIFKAFSQADNSITRQFGGTGLGLSISSKIIQAHDSVIKLESKENEGSEFSFNIKFDANSKTNKNLERFKNIKTVIYDEENIEDLFLPTIKEYLELITISKSIKKDDFENIKDTNIIFLSEESLDENIINFAQSKQCKLVIISNKEKVFENITNYVCLTLPLNLSVLFNVLIESMDKTNLIINHKIEEYNSFKGKVLIVEDHEINQELITILLDLRNLDYKIASNGQEAVDIYKKESFDLILMDINMPIKNGIEASKEIIEYENENNINHTPIVALSANAIDVDIKKALEIGISDYLYKPINEDRLDEVLKTYVQDKSPKISVSFDIEEASQKLGISSVIVQKLVSRFFESIDNDLEELDEHILKANKVKIKELAHKIRGAALNLRLDDISACAKTIEDNSQEETLEIQKSFNKLTQIIKELKKLL